MEYFDTLAFGATFQRGERGTIVLPAEWPGDLRDLEASCSPPLLTTAVVAFCTGDGVCGFDLTDGTRIHVGDPPVAALETYWHSPAGHVDACQQAAVVRYAPDVDALGPETTEWIVVASFVPCRF